MKIDLTKQELELILDCISVAESQEITEELVKLREKIEKIVDE